MLAVSAPGWPAVRTRRQPAGWPPGRWRWPAARRAECWAERAGDLVDADLGRRRRGGGGAGGGRDWGAQPVSVITVMAAAAGMATARAGPRGGPCRMMWRGCS